MRPIDLGTTASVQQKYENHPDYQSNLAWARKFMVLNESDLPEGVRLMITSGNQPQEYLTFMFKTPREWSGSGFAHHVALQQEEGMFHDQAHKTHRFYTKIANEEYYYNFIKNRHDIK